MHVHVAFVVRGKAGKKIKVALCQKRNFTEFGKSQTWGKLRPAFRFRMCAHAFLPFSAPLPVEVLGAGCLGPCACSARLGWALLPRMAPQEAAPQCKPRSVCGLVSPAGGCRRRWAPAAPSTVFSQMMVFNR